MTVLKNWKLNFTIDKTFQWNLAVPQRFRNKILFFEITQ